MAAAKKCENATCVEKLADKFRAAEIVFTAERALIGEAISRCIELGLQPESENRGTPVISVLVPLVDNQSTTTRKEFAKLMAPVSVTIVSFELVELICPPAQSSAPAVSEPQS